MGKTFSVTVYPSPHGADYLSASDAMRQILDLVDVLGRAEMAERGTKQIVWRLTEAHTNSPPFTVTLQAFAVDPVVSVGFEADRITSQFGDAVRALMNGHKADWIDKDIAAPLKRVFQRNLNGIGQTSIAIEGSEGLDVVPDRARSAVMALEQAELEEEAAVIDYSRFEYGSAEVEIQGLSRWNERPALNVVDRLSESKVVCVLSQELAEEIGPIHQWREVWENKRLIVTGILHFDRENHLKRIEAFAIEEMPWTDVPLTSLRDLDLLNGKTVSEHLRGIRGENGA